MKRSRFSEEQIIGILKQVDAGVKVGDICSEQGISGATFYKWRSKYGGLERKGTIPPPFLYLHVETYAVLKGVFDHHP